MKKIKENIVDKDVDFKNLIKFYNDQEFLASKNESSLLDQQAGQAAKDMSLGENQTLPQIKLERLANELNQLENELRDLEKDDIPNQYNSEFDSTN